MKKVLLYTLAVIFILGLIGACFGESETETTNNGTSDSAVATTEEEKKEQQKKALEEAKKKHEKTHDVIESILAQPAKFWETNDISSFANSLLGTIIIPDTKEKRSATAGGILFGLAKSKNKEIASIKDNSRQGLIAKLKEMQLARAKAHEKIFN